MTQKYFIFSPGYFHYLQSLPIEACINDQQHLDAYWKKVNW